MVFLNQPPRMPGKQSYKLAADTLLEHIETLHPAAPGEESRVVSLTETALDTFIPISKLEADLNEDCYWDKKVIKEKRQLEESVARMKAENASERFAQNQDAVSEQAAISAVRRSNSPDDALGYYTLFK